MAQEYAAVTRRVDSLFPLAGNHVFTCAIVGVAITFLVAFSLYSYVPPPAVPADAPPAEFSSARAMKHLEAITKRTHPAGTVENAQVRDYIIQELRSAGLEVEVQKATGLNQQREGLLRAGTVQNVMGRLRGTDNTKAIMLAAHYDSWPNSFGASDDGAGVAAILETLRALKARAPLKNDLILLFTDGEESGLLGANAFVDEHPWFREVGLSLNFEARGNSGPSIMFETSEDNGWLVEELSKVAPRPVAHSLAYEIYRFMPNDTDLTVFRKGGIAGLGFAYIEGYPAYHTTLDTFYGIDERSLQHHGSYASSLASHFGNLNLQEIKKHDAVYFDILSSKLIHYPVSWVLPLAILVSLLFSWSLVVGFRRGQLTLLGILWGVVALPLCILLASGMARLLWGLVSWMQDGTGLRPQGETYNADLYFLSFVSLAVAVTSACYVLLRSRATVSSLTVGGLLWWCVLMLMTSVFMPHASYLFTWPLMFSLLALFAVSFSALPKQSIFKAVALLLLGALPGVVLSVPLIYHTFVGLSLTNIGIVIAAVTLILGLLIPHLNLLTQTRKWLLPAGLALFSLGLLFGVGLMSRPSAVQPALSHIFYALNAEAGRAVWASLDKEPDAWTSQFFAGDIKREPLSEFFAASDSGAFLQTPAPALALKAPEVELLADERGDGMRTLRLHIASPRQANLVTIYVDSKADFVMKSLNGKVVDSDHLPGAAERKNFWSLRYYALPPEGIELVAETKTSEPLKMRVVDQSFGLPEIQGRAFAARADTMIPPPLLVTDSVMVSKTFTF
jgi:hypothetical protein